MIMRYASLLAMLLIFSFSGGCGAPLKSFEHSILCAIFLSGDAGPDGEMLDAAADVRRASKHKAHFIVFLPESRDNPEIKALLAARRIKSFPAAAAGDKTAFSGSALPDACYAAARWPGQPLELSPHLTMDIAGGKDLAATFYVCSVKKGRPLLKGRLAVFLVREEKITGGRSFPVFQAMLADRPGYNVSGGSCRVPENEYWTPPPGQEFQSYYAVMAVYDRYGNILKSVCSSKKCSERG
ncbi:MAG: hypothetical protein ACM3WV_10990 [Bacillota bacterium]